MRLNVTFQSSCPVDMNAQPIGSELAAYLVERLGEHGLVIRGHDNHDDFAWSIDTELGPWVLLGYVGDEEYEWLAQIQSSVGWFGRLVGRSDQTEREQIARILQQLLSTDASFRTVRWHEGDFAEENGTAEP